MQKFTTCEICSKLRACLAVLIFGDMETWACRRCIRENKQHVKVLPN